MAGNDRKRLATERTTSAAQSISRQTISTQLELARLANEKGNVAALDTARTAITTARSTDTR